MERLQEEAEEVEGQFRRRMRAREDGKTRAIRKRKEKSYRLALQNAIRSPRFRVNTV